MVVVDMEDADGQSPKEGSRGSKRKSKREVRCMQLTQTYRDVAGLANTFLSSPFSPVRDLRRTTLSWSMSTKLTVV
jgi:hypothetical protein